MNISPLNKDRALGSLLGLAIGDALGTTLEFSSKGSFAPISDMNGGGPFNLKAGQWTDDTSMALCLGHSLLHCKGFDPKDQMNRYCNWWQYGYMSSTGNCFDIGGTVSAALSRYLQTAEPFSGDIDPLSAGNGSLMRLAPVPIYWQAHKDLAIFYAGESSRTTHGAAECIDACKAYTALMVDAINGGDKTKLLNCGYSAETPKVSDILAGKFLKKNESEIFGSGYVVESMEASLWCFFTTEDYQSAVLKAANLGDDADTTAAICGQLAGAYYGFSKLPVKWLTLLHEHQEITALANHLFDAETPV